MMAEEEIDDSSHGIKDKTTVQRQKERDTRRNGR